MVAAVAFVTFDGFYAACLMRKGHGQAVAVLRARRVLDSSPAARKLGVTPGLSAPEARYAARGCVRFITFNEGDYVEEAGRWLNVCAEFTTAIEPLDPASAFLDLSSLPGARELATPLAADIYSAIRLCPRIGIAGGKLSARLATSAVMEGGDAAFLAPLPIESLWPAKPEHLRRLRFLGYGTIGQVAKLPIELLQKQFGQAGLQLSLWARGIDHSQVSPLYPPDELSSRFYFPQPVRLDAELEAGLRVLADRLGSVLQARDQQAANLNIEVSFETCVRSAERSFTSPIQSPGALLTALRLTLRLIPIESEVSSLSVKLPKVVPASRKQLVFEGKDTASAEGALKRLQDTFGRNVIRPASSFLPTRREQALKAYKGHDSI
jgi:DNA polymerase-4